MSLGRDSERAARLGFYSTGIGVFVLWNLGTAIGLLGASWLAEPRVLGLDAAAPAAFLALLAPRLRGHEAWAVALAAAMVALIAVPFVPVGFPVLIAALSRSGWWPACYRSAPQPAPGADGIGRGGVAVTPSGSVSWSAPPGATCSSWPVCRYRSSVLEQPRLLRIAGLLPVVLLSALVAVQTFSIGSELMIDARAAGLPVPPASPSGGAGRSWWWSRWRRSPPRWSGCGYPAADQQVRSSRSRTRVPKVSASTGTRSSTPWNNAEKSRSAGSRSGEKP